MPVEIIKPESANTYAAAIARAAQALQRGALVIFPTETVYGVAANAADPKAVARLRSAKGRDDGRPFTVHIASRADARRFVSRPSPLLRRLVRKGWPGPLTLICESPDPRAEPIAAQLTSVRFENVYFERTVGLRCPDHALAERLLRDAGVPVVASSANRAGQPPPFDVHAAAAALGPDCEFALDGGRTPLNAASTIVEVRANQWTLVRSGALDERVIGRMARSEILFVCTGNTCRSPLAEYLFRQHLAERLSCTAERLAENGYYVSSAGAFAFGGGPASAGTLEELHRRGIDASPHRSQPLTVELVQRAERIFAMTPEHRAAVLALAPGVAHRVELLDPTAPVADPIGGGAEDYRRCAAQVEAAVDHRLEEFLNEDRDW